MLTHLYDFMVGRWHNHGGVPPANNLIIPFDQPVQKINPDLKIQNLINKFTHLKFNMDFLQSIQSITPISDPAKQKLSEVAEKFEISRNESLLIEGKLCDYIYYIEKGCVRGFGNHDGNEVTYWFSTEGFFATSFASFITRKPSREGIRSIEPSTIVRIHYDDMSLLFAQYHEMETLGRLISQKYYLQLEERTYALQFQSAKERYQQLMTDSPELLKRAPLGYIASYLGISQETLSRIRTKI